MTSPQTVRASAHLCIRVDSPALCYVQYTCRVLCTLNGHLRPGVTRSKQVMAVASCTPAGCRAGAECFSCPNSCEACSSLFLPRRKLKHTVVRLLRKRDEGSGFWPPDAVCNHSTFRTWRRSPTCRDSQFCEWYFFFNITLSDGLTLRVEIESHKNGEINISETNANFVFS